MRRVRDKREQLTRETAAFLLHLAEAGPMTLTELSRHLDRAPSTLSEMVDHLEAKDLIRREPDGNLTIELPRNPKASAFVFGER